MRPALSVLGSMMRKEGLKGKEAVGCPSFPFPCDRQRQGGSHFLAHHCLPSALEAMKVVCQASVASLGF